MTTHLPPGARVRLTADFEDAGGVRFKAGQVGVLRGRLDGHSLVDFEGYTSERIALSRGADSLESAMAAATAPWLGAVPHALLAAEDSHDPEAGGER